MHTEHSTVRLETPKIKIEIIVIKKMRKKNRRQENLNKIDTKAKKNPHKFF